VHWVRNEFMMGNPASDCPSARGHDSRFLQTRRRASAGIDRNRGRTAQANRYASVRRARSLPFRYPRTCLLERLLSACCGCADEVIMEGVERLDRMLNNSQRNLRPRYGA
jgi:hypothetical protein